VVLPHTTPIQRSFRFAVTLADTTRTQALKIGEADPPLLVFEGVMSSLALDLAAARRLAKKTQMRQRWMRARTKKKRRWTIKKS
jgi:hypothetical protein